MPDQLTRELSAYLARADRLSKLKIEFQGLSKEHADHEVALYKRLHALGKPVDSQGLLWTARGGTLKTQEIYYGHEADDLERSREASDAAPVGIATPFLAGDPCPSCRGARTFRTTDNRWWRCLDCGDAWETKSAEPCPCGNGEAVVKVPTIKGETEVLCPACAEAATDPYTEKSAC